jgi:hypothetical protein
MRLHRVPRLIPFPAIKAIRLPRILGITTGQMQHRCASLRHTLLQRLPLLVFRLQVGHRPTPGIKDHRLLFDSPLLFSNPHRQHRTMIHRRVPAGAAAVVRL